MEDRTVLTIKNEEINMAKSSSKKGKSQPNNQNNLTNFQNKDNRFTLAGQNYSGISDLVKILDDEALGTQVINSAQILCLTIIILAQLRLSITNESNQFADGLPSFKLYKKRIIGGFPGRVWCTCIAILECTQYIKEDEIKDLLIGFLNKEIIPCTKCGKPNRDNYIHYIEYRRTQILGLLQSCPASNIKTFGLDSNCKTWDLNTALKFIDTELNIKDIDSSIDLSSEFKNLFLANKGGIPNDKITLEEANIIKSKVESSLLGEKIVRTEEVINKKDGQASTLSIQLSDEQIKENLSAFEFLQYKSAKRDLTNTYSKTVLRKLTKIVEDKIKSSSEDPVQGKQPQEGETERGPDSI